MCLNPIKIKNNFKYPGVSTRTSQMINRYIYVPCGHCVECQQNRQSDIGSLSYAEQRISDLTMFYTLTYDDKHLPVYNAITGRFSRGFGNLCKSDYNYGNIPCFSREDIQRFYKNVRIRVERYCQSMHYTLPIIKYMNCCEYGSQKSHRAHYHGMIYFRWLDGQYKRLNEFSQSLLRSTIEDIVETSWSLKREQKREKGRFTSFSVNDRLGNVHSSPKGYWVESYRASYYASKYSTKDITFFSQPLFLEWSKRVPTLFQDMKDYLPKFTHSKNFGMDLLNDFNGKDINSIISMIDRGFEIKSQTLSTGKVFFHRYPRNIVDRLFFDTSYDLVFKRDKIDAYNKSSECVMLITSDYIEKYWTTSQRKRAALPHLYYYDIDKKMYESRFAVIRQKKEIKYDMLDSYIKIKDLRDEKIIDNLWSHFSTGYYNGFIVSSGLRGEIEKDNLEICKEIYTSKDFFKLAYRCYRYIGTLLMNCSKTLSLDNLYDDNYFNIIIDSCRRFSLDRDYSDVNYYRSSYVDRQVISGQLGNNRDFLDVYIHPMEFILELENRSHTAEIERKRADKLRVNNFKKRVLGYE